MAYQIDRYSNSILTVIEDGTVDQTTDLKFIGKNYAGYGEIQNENFLFLLENFAGANPPPKAISGQMWFDSSANKLKFYDGTKFRTTGGAEISATQPSGLTQGDFWWDTSNNQLYAYNGTSFILVGPQGSGAGITQMQSRILTDINGATHSAIVATLNDEPVAIFSAVANYDLAADNDGITNTDFPKVKTGITLKSVSTDGISEDLGNETNLFWGTASNANKLGGVDASQFIQAGSASFTGQTIFPDDGISIGNENDLKIIVENDNQASIANDSGLSSVIKFKANNASGTLTHSITVNAVGIMPGMTGTYNLGAPTFKFANVYADQIDGNATTATGIQLSGTTYNGAISSVPTSTALRDGNGNIAANLFQGTATQAQFADLAEKYSTEKELPAGTAVAVSSNTEFEVEPAGTSQMCIGVVSTDPAYMMNSEAEGQYIGLKGRLPVRVKGPVSKGMPIYAWEDGVCTTIASTALVGVALESNSSEEEKLVECVLKV